MSLDIFSKLSILRDNRVKFLLISTFLTALSASILSPVKSIYISSFNISLLQLGILFTMSIVVSILLDSPLGTLCDHLSRKKILIASGVMSVIVLFLMTLARSFQAFFLIFLLEGLTLAMYNISLWSYLQDVIKKTKLNYSIISVFWMFAGIIGPYIGGYVGSINNTYAFYAGIVCELTGLFFAFRIPHLAKKTESLKDGFKEAFKGVYVDEFKSYVKTNNNVKVSTFFNVTLSYEGNILYSFIPVYLYSFFGMSELWIGVFFSVIEVFALIVRSLEFLFFNRIIKKNLIIVSSIITAVCYLILPTVNSLFLFLSLILVANFFSYIIYPLTYQIFINALPKHKKGEVIGMDQTLTDLGGAFGNLVGGFVSNSLGIPSALFSSAFLYISGSGLALFIKRSSKRQAEVELIKMGKKID